jgi:hypothetical protein
MVALQVSPEVLRTANRLADNEGKSVVLEGLAVDCASRACVHLDRTDAIVPVAGHAAWDPDLRSRPVRASGILRRHAAANDPRTGIASLELVDARIEAISLPVDGRIRTAPALHAAAGSNVDVEGMAYRSRNGPILVIYGGLAYVHGLPDWDKVTVSKTVVVSGRVRNGKLPPGAPAAGGTWAIDATRFEPVPRR